MQLREEFPQLIRLIPFVDDADVLLYALVRIQLASIADCDAYRIANEVARQALHLLRPRGCEKERLALRRDLVNDCPNLGLEAHVEHAIGLIKGECRDVGQTDLAHLDDVVQATRRGDDHLHPALYSLDLWVLRGTTWKNIEHESGMTYIESFPLTIVTKKNL